MSKDNRRQYPRIDARIAVEFATPEAYVTEYTKNISKGGIFVKTHTLPDPNSVVELKLKFPGAKHEVAILAKVARMVTMSNPSKEGEHLYGVGFVFIEWSTKAKRVFDNYYAKLGK